MSWTKLEKGVQFSSFGHKISYAGFVIRDQVELDGIIDIADEMHEAGFSDHDIAEATCEFLRKRRLH
jgi:hypothetical protein